MFNLEGLIPKLCKIGQELREDDKGLRLRSAALQALASMVTVFLTKFFPMNVIRHSSWISCMNYIDMTWSFLGPKCILCSLYV